MRGNAPDPHACTSLTLSRAFAVTAFAKATGDIHTLSRTDLKLLALAHTLEVAAHGSAHLRSSPSQALIKPKHHSRESRALPGWGQVANPEDWKVVDEAPEEAGQHGGCASHRGPTDRTTDQGRQGPYRALGGPSE